MPPAYGRPATEISPRAALRGGRRPRKARGRTRQHGCTRVVVSLDVLYVVDSGGQPSLGRPRLSWRTACTMRCSFSIRANRTNLSPAGPNPTPGDTATSHSLTIRVANAIEPISAYASGIWAQTNIVPRGRSTGQPIRA